MEMAKNLQVVETSFLSYPGGDGQRDLDLDLMRKLMRIFGAFWLILTAVLLY